MRAWQNSCVDVLGGEACRLLHAVRSTGQLKFYFHEVTLKQEVGFQKMFPSDRMGMVGDAHGSVELMGL